MSATISNRTAFFQGMRVLALLTVLFSHAGHSLVALALPMSFFFVLSGFLYKDKGESYKQYVLGRCLKIYPIFLLTFVIDFFLNHRVLSWKMIPHLFLLQTYYPMPEISESVDPFYYEYLGVSWFISSLLFCYLIAPFIYRLICRFNREVLVVLLLALILVNCVYLSVDVPAEYKKWCFYVSPYYRLIEYVCGMLLAQLFRETETRTPSHSFVGAVLLIAWFVISYWWNFGMCSMLPNLVLIGYLYQCDSPVLTKILGNKMMVLCAAHIMPIYLLHESIMECVHTHGGGWIWSLVISMAVSIPYAICWKYFNKKIRIG